MPLHPGTSVVMALLCMCSVFRATIPPQEVCRVEMELSFMYLGIYVLIPKSDIAQSAIHCFKIRTEWELGGWTHSVSKTVIPDHSGGRAVIEFDSKRRVFRLDMCDHSRGKGLVMPQL